MNTIVFFEIFYLLSSRSLNMSFLETVKMKNRVLIPGILLTILLQFIAIYTPFSGILRLTPLDATAWLEIIALSSSVFILSELSKTYSRR